MASPRLLAILLLLAGPAAAADRPQTLPSRDVDVTYELIPPPDAARPQHLSQRIRWSAAPQLLRVDTPSPGLYVVMDYRAHLLSAVRPAERLVLTVPSAGQQMPVGIPPSGPGGFERQGQSRIAGLTCDDWLTRDAAHQATIVCLTEDGVLLRAVVGGGALVQAVQVSFAPVPADIFVVPADFRRVGMAPGK